MPKKSKKATKQEILQTLAPCGLNCCKCFAFAEGEIRILSERLQELLGDFDRYAERFAEFLPVFKNYSSFKKLLHFFSQGDCLGCRNGTCKYPDCGVIKCYKKKKVDFCYQCDEFPCRKTNFDPDLEMRWIQMNTRMKEIGIEAYYEESRLLPRYK
jgi:hypothetical protein